MNHPFLWGAATSAHQVEGYNDHSDWAHWEAAGKIEGGVRSGAATDHWHRFREDLTLTRELGINSYRFSIEWAKCEPEAGRWDESAFAWYRELVAECEKQGILPMATLHHFTLPQWFAEKGGFAADDSVACFLRFVERVIAEIGPRIPLWCTINEPLVLVAGGYLGEFMPPAVFSTSLAGKAFHNLLLCHAKAYDLLHAAKTPRQGPWKDLPLQVGLAHNMLDFMPSRAWHPIEVVLARVLDRFYNRSFLDAIVGRKQNFGVPWLLPKAPAVVEALGRRTADFIGVNYYTKAYVQWRPRDESESNTPNLPVGIAFSRRGETASDLGWALHPEGFRRVLRKAGRYGLPIYVTENGIADEMDLQRPGYLRSHLGVIADLIAEGLDIRGYYHWSLLDNFEWVKGFKPRFGLLRVNYETFARELTSSARLYQSMIFAHRSVPGQRPTPEILTQP